MDNLLTGLNGGNVPALELIFMITLVALLPSIVVMMTSFTRTIIILSFTRNAMGIQQTPPNLVLAGISLFLTLYIMGPVIGQINETAYQPYLRGELTQEEAVAQMVCSNERIHAAQHGKGNIRSFCGNVRNRDKGGCNGLSNDHSDSCFYDQ